VVEMTEKYLKAQEDKAFEAAFARFNVTPKAKRTYEPQTPKTSWYLDHECGGPNPTFKKPGIQYDEDAAMSDEIR
jgi:hypothetical protein